MTTPEEFPPPADLAATANVGAQAYARAAADPGEDLNAELRAHVARELGPVARPREVVVDELHKTRSGKIMRRLLLDVSAGREPGDTTSLVDPDAFTRLATGFGDR